MRFPTTTPTETIVRAVDFFARQPELVVAVGIGAYGPVDLDPSSPSLAGSRRRRSLGGAGPHYLALALVTCICTLAPQRIILGGVMQQTHLL